MMNAIAVPVSTTSQDPRAPSLRGTPWLPAPVEEATVTLIPDAKTVGIEIATGRSASRVRSHHGPLSLTS